MPPNDVDDDDDDEIQNLEERYDDRRFSYCRILLREQWTAEMSNLESLVASDVEQQDFDATVHITRMNRI